mmetsp:Transcript_15611/g.48832  ORF Transcript_15611/g.48832 Transcript_15611/m.48832 type:complete len:315 (-) Transcript_15611:204-1148(-)
MDIEAAKRLLTRYGLEKLRASKRVKQGVVIQMFEVKPAEAGWHRVTLNDGLGTGPGRIAAEEMESSGICSGDLIRITRSQPERETIVIRKAERVDLPLRFGVGERVECHAADTGPIDLGTGREWKTGSVTHTWFRLPSWGEGYRAPYRVRLDDEIPFRIVRKDDARIIRKSNSKKKKTAQKPIAWRVAIALHVAAAAEDGRSVLSESADDDPETGKKVREPLEEHIQFVMRQTQSSRESAIAALRVAMDGGDAPDFFRALSAHASDDLELIPLGHGWFHRRDPASGNLFFQHERTGRTQWETPPELKGKLPSAR